jgi:hypothetical protein
VQFRLPLSVSRAQEIAVLEMLLYEDPRHSCSESRYDPPLRNLTFHGELRTAKRLSGRKCFFAVIEQNALNYSVGFARRDSFYSNRLTRLLSIPRGGINVYSVRSLVDYIRPEVSTTPAHVFAVYAVKGTCRIVRQPKFTTRKIMYFFPKLNNRNRGKRLTITSVLLLALAIAPPVLQAQDWDQINGRDKVHDPTGAWLVRFHNSDDRILHREFSLIVFHKGGTLTQDNQGESGFDPAAVSLPPSDPNYSNNVISSPLSGVWQKTGWNTFAGTLLTIEYHNALNPGPDVSLFQFTNYAIAKLQRARRTLTRESVV